jgi:putative transposase
MALACEPPAASGRPVSHWTAREIADEAVQREIVPSISAASVGRFLKRGENQAPSKPLLADAHP